MTAPHDDCAALQSELDHAMQEADAASAEVAALRLKCAGLEAALRQIVNVIGPEELADCVACDGCSAEMNEGLRLAKAALSGEPTALREMLAAAFDAGFRERDGGERWDGYSDGDDYAAGILKGGGR